MPDVVVVGGVGLLSGEQHADRAATRGCDAVGLRDYGICSLDADGIVTSWDAGAERMTGYRRREIVGRDFAVFYPPDRIASGVPRWELARASDGGFHVDQGWRLRKDGTRFWAHVLITAQRCSADGVTGFVQVTRDASAFQAKYDRARRRFTDLFVLAREGIGVFDEWERLLDANGALCDLLGYRPEDIDGLTSMDLLAPDDRDTPLIPPMRQSASPAGTPQGTQRTLLRSDGQPIVCEVLGTESVQENGHRVQMLAFRDLTEEIHHAELQHSQATHDQLTGLLNRQGVHEQLDTLLGDRVDHGTAALAVLLCGLDNFKRVNVSLGHEAGDELLIAVARRLVNELPRQCTPARLYGDEYLIMCTDTDACGGLDALIAQVTELLRMVVPVGERPVHVSASIGAARVTDSSTTSDDLVRLADAAMLEAKRRRPGGSSVIHPALLSTINRQVPLEAELRTALDHDGLALHYQPIVSGDGAVIMAEALLRWPHPERGILSPEAILPVAKRANLLNTLDQWVLRTSLREAADWPEQHGHPVAIAVNLGGLRPDQPHFTDTITRALTASGTDAHRVVLEMTETTYVDLSARPRQTMTALHERGIRFAMDDFGTGYSSLARLKDLPTHIIKLDRRFVAGLGHDYADLGIAQAVVDLAHAIGRDCVAEGVETAIQFHLLRSLGLGAYQGWLFSPALPAAEFQALLSQDSLPIPASQ